MLPINGRVAIVDDKIDQIKFLIDDLSKNHIPYRYYNGDLDSLPEEGGSTNNDFRILFMDINLIDDGEQTEKNIISKLNAVLNRLIPINNYPYVLVYWSRHENKYKDLIENILFNTDDLKLKRPIAFISADKSNYVNLSGNSVEGVNNVIVNDIQRELERFPAYQTLLHWENLLHTAADKTIQELFSFKDASSEDWSNASLDLLKRFTIASLGQHHEVEKNSQIKIKASLSVLKEVFVDTLEKEISLASLSDCNLDQVRDTNKIDKSLVNSKLLIDDTNIETNLNLVMPGTVLRIDDISKFTNLIEAIFSGKQGIKQNQIKDECKMNSFLVTICVDPMCDFAQNKVAHSRFVDGVMLQISDLKKISNNSEVFFYSPIFKYQDIDHCLVLNFKYLRTDEITTNEANASNQNPNTVEIKVADAASTKDAVATRAYPATEALPMKKDLQSSSNVKTPIFRVRQQMLAEIQSKLARHISRQGILSIE